MNLKENCLCYVFDTHARSQTMADFRGLRLELKINTFIKMTEIPSDKIK